MTGSAPEIRYELGRSLRLHPIPVALRSRRTTQRSRRWSAATRSVPLGRQPVFKGQAEQPGSEPESQHRCARSLGQGGKTTTTFRTTAARPHVFCVDDSQDFLEFIRTLFTEASYDVTTAGFLETTFPHIRAAQPSVILIDLKPGQSAGFGLVQQLRGSEETSRIALVFLSTSRRLLDQMPKGPAGGAGEVFLPKPFAIDDMLDAVGELLRRAGADKRPYSGPNVGRDLPRVCV